MSLVVASLVGVIAGCGTVLVAQLRRRRVAGRALPAPTVAPARVPSAIFAGHLARRADYHVQVGVPLTTPIRWVAARRYSARELVLADHTVVAVADVRAYAIADGEGRLVALDREGLPMPSGLRTRAQTRDERDRFTVIDLDLLARGRARVAVVHGPAPSAQLTDYATSLTNLGDEPVRVVRFAACRLRGPRARTVTGTWFSAADFVAWYGAPLDGWLAPGETVTDPDNYGAAVAWVYECETASGVRFATGAPAPALARGTAPLVDEHDDRSAA